MERYIAIDNVCAWPNLTPMPDGRIVATIFNQPCHGQWEGDVECWESADEGRFWKRCGVPAPHEPETNRMNVAAGLARDGALVVIASGWGGKDFRDHTLPAWVCRSTDGGRTWERDGGFPPPDGMSNIIPFGDIIQLPDGDLGASGYVHKAIGERKVSRSCFVRSRDDGRTWGEHVAIAETYNETDLLCPDGQRLIAAARSSRGGCLELYESEDGGKSWVDRGPLTGPCQHPAHLVKLSDGHTVVTYGIRYRGLYGVGARVSEDDGRTWMSPMVLVSVDDAFDGGYPSSVEVSDGNILTAYYASGVRAHTRYHMGVVRWNVQEIAQLNRKV